MSPEQASEFYDQHTSKLYFPSLVGYMSSQPLIALRLGREKAIEYWRNMVGPTNPETARITHPDRYVTWVV